MSDKHKAKSAEAEHKREQLRQKVADSRADLTARSLPDRNPPEGLRALAMDYPIALVVGGLAAGVLAGAFLPRASRKLARGAIAAATVASELGLTYGRQAIDKAGDVSTEGRHLLGELGDKLSELGGTMSESAGTYGRKAADAAGDAADVARDTGLRIAQQVVRLTSQLRH